MIFRTSTRRTSFFDKEGKHGLEPKRIISPPFGRESLPSEIPVGGVLSFISTLVVSDQLAFAPPLLWGWLSPLSVVTGDRLWP